MKQVAVGDRVKVKTTFIKGEGTVTFIDSPNLFSHEFMPVQVEMDEPDDAGQTIKRFNIKEVKPIG